MFESFGQPYAFQRTHRQRATIAFDARAVVEQRQFDIVYRTGTRQKIETLKDETELLIAKVSQRIT